MEEVLDPKTDPKPEPVKGLGVADRTFDLTLPVSGLKLSLRYATRADKKAALAYAGKSDDAADRFEFKYLSRVIVSPQLSVENLMELPEKDLIALKVADDKINNLSQEEVEALVKDFAIALK